MARRPGKRPSLFGATLRPVGRTLVNEVLKAVDAFDRLRDRVAIGWAHATGTRRRITQVSAARGERYAIIATWGKARISPDVERAAKAAHAEGFNVILAHNGELDRGYLNSVAAFVHVLIERPNVGRDFGGYQDGVRYLQTLPAAPKRVLFANDSIFYAPKGLAELTHDLNDDRYAYIGLAENSEFHYHVGSFLFSVNEAVFQSKPFRKFWKRYFPYGTRRHMIDNGEILLSQMLVKKGGFTPHVLYAGSHLGPIMRHWGPAELRENFFLFSNTMRQAILEAPLLEVFAQRALAPDYGDVGTPPVASPEQNAARAISMAELMQKIVMQIERGNSLHHAGGLFAKYLGMPIVKKDLAYRDVMGMTELIQLMTDIGYPDIGYVKRDLRRRGTFASLKGFQRFRFERGYL